LTYRFGAFALDRESYRLLKGDAPLALAPKVIDLLFLLASRPGALVTKDDILQALWPGIAVTDNAITQVVSDLRQALGDDASAPAYVQTVPRRGYRFIATVEALEAPAASEPPPAAPAGARRTSPRRIVVMNFTNVAGDPGVDWLSAGIAETVTNDLRAVRDLVVLDRAVAADGARAGADLAVVGSFQRSGDGLRLTARVVDVRTREAIAHAKADGPIADVFRLQDALVADLAAALPLTVTPAAAARMRARETSNLDAYRALTEGRLKLETLDPADVPAAIAHFERAVALDPRYALAHVGLAHARFWQFQASRARQRPDVNARAAAVAHARQAIAIDADLAEAHSALAFFLAGADQPPEAVASGRLAVALEPGNWRHHFRLGVAAWGRERLAAMQFVTAAYPQMAYAYFAAAMVHVARNDLAIAESILRQGLAFESEAASGPARLPGSGLHWLLGLCRLAGGDAAGARREFDRELAPGARGIFSSEFMMDAQNGHGFALMEAGDLSGAAAMFERALAAYPDHARSLLGLAAVRLRQERSADARALRERCRAAITGLREQGRHADGAMAAAFADMLFDGPEAAIRALARLLAEAPAGFAGWTMPVEPLLTPLRGDAAFRAQLARLADRAT
jgi:DNA-binding winged helix-turn-helix (wHTH) protein/tetratricopeptide (TPR) repeat protein